MKKFPQALFALVLVLIALPGAARADWFSDLGEKLKKAISMLATSAADTMEKSAVKLERGERKQQLLKSKKELLDQFRNQYPQYADLDDAALMAKIREIVLGEYPMGGSYTIVETYRGPSKNLSAKLRREIRELETVQFVKKLEDVKAAPGNKSE